MFGCYYKKVVTGVVLVAFSMFPPSSYAYDFVIQWSFPGKYSTAYQACQSFFSWYQSYYSSPDDKLSNFKVTYQSDSNYICSYDLERPHGDFKGSVSVTREGESCPYGFVFDKQTSMCVKYPSQCPQVSNPIEVSTGRKTEDFVDIQLQGLRLLRSYRQYGGEGVWSFGFDESLIQLKQGGAVLTLDDTEVYVYSKGGGRISL
ncbi:hypothetical protein [Agaribacterium sp. ZY112]|uniref:hypothetical protein n=1 Tax=Agaribacterium sp. ZY112 TaxID=3233574 RepID=UPI00352651C8